MYLSSDTQTVQLNAQAYRGHSDLTENSVFVCKNCVHFVCIRGAPTLQWVTFDNFHQMHWIDNQRDIKNVLFQPKDLINRY